MRANPRSVILAALQEGPRTLRQIGHALHRHLSRERRRRLVIERLEQRHLCKLIRSKQAVRLADGKYALHLSTRQLREKLATTGPLKPGEVDAALREARDLRARLGDGEEASSALIDTRKPYTMHAVGRLVHVEMVQQGPTRIFMRFRPED